MADQSGNRTHEDERRSLDIEHGWVEVKKKTRVPNRVDNEARRNDNFAHRPQQSRRQYNNRKDKNEGARNLKTFPKEDRSGDIAEKVEKLVVKPVVVVPVEISAPKPCDNPWTENRRKEFKPEVTVEVQEKKDIQLDAAEVQAEIQNGDSTNGSCLTEEIEVKETVSLPVEAEKQVVVVPNKTEPVKAVEVQNEEDEGWSEVKKKQRAPKTEKASEVRPRYGQERRQQNFKDYGKFANRPIRNFQQRDNNDNKNAQFRNTNSKTANLEKN